MSEGTDMRIETAHAAREHALEAHDTIENESPNRTKVGGSFHADTMIRHLFFALHGLEDPT